MKHAVQAPLRAANSGRRHNHRYSYVGFCAGGGELLGGAGV
jgi:hypothetical protein